MDQSGLVRGSSEGTAIITAMSGNVDASAQITVTQPQQPQPQGLAGAYLVQAIQSLSQSVPLVAGEPALLRVFLATPSSGATVPRVIARFTVQGAEVHVEDIPASSAMIPESDSIQEFWYSKNPSAMIPASVVSPGLEMVVEIDPDNTLDPGLGIPKRIPATGRRSVDVREVPTLDITFIPFLWEEEPHREILETTRDLAANPAGHSLLESARVLLPVGDIDATLHEPVTTSSNNGRDILDQVLALRALEGGTGHYMGMISGPYADNIQGVATMPGWSSFAIPSAWVMAHELGHNMSLRHAPCSTPDPDPAYPHSDGTVGIWGWDHSEGKITRPSYYDLMGYCPRQAWIGDYSFGIALNHRVGSPGPPPPVAVSPVRSLLVWGGTDPAGTPFLYPAFVADAVPSLPHEQGAHSLRGFGPDGTRLFAFTFGMPERADDPSSGFAFALPVEPAWAQSLATIVLSGPGGQATLDTATDQPMAILRDRETGRVRAFLSGSSAQAMGATVDASPSGLLFSRGIPGPDAWRR